MNIHRVDTERFKRLLLSDENETSLANFFVGKGPFVAFIGSIVMWFLDSVQVLIVSLAIFIVFHLFIVSPHTIEGPSMEPNFCRGDVILADKLTPLFRGYTYGDVIIFKKNDNEDYIKRIIGLGGDRIKIEEGKVYRNGELLNESYLPVNRLTELPSGAKMVEGEEYIVPSGHLFVLGDNRRQSADSRFFLSIDPSVNTIKGRVVVVIWPVRDFRLFNPSETRPENICHTNNY
jgi:signal peptidase I